ncbi:hypothetical protein ACFLR4_01900 [Bacteroidota bacterium]
MLLKKGIFFTLMVLLSNSIFPQNQTYQIEFQKMIGELSQKDLTNEGFGRYDGYEINFNEGERVHFLVHSENFVPSLILVNPEGETFQQDIEQNDEYATVQAKINQSGDWILYVIGDANSLGKYFFQYGIAAPELFSINENADFCDELDFILAHAVAYFIFLGDDDETILKIDGAKDAYIDGHDASYNAELYDGNSIGDAQRMFNYIGDEVKKCISDKWLKSDRGWMKVRDYRERYFLVTENISKEPRFVRIGLLDFRDSPDHDQSDYLVDISVGRK